MMDIVTIDFETYYSKEYTLSKMTTEAYIRDPRFEVIGVGIKINDYPTDWYSGDDPGKFLRSLNYKNKAILCHNTVFDGAILSWHFGIQPKLWLDTLSMARPLHNVTVGGSLKALAAHYKLGAKGDEVVNALGKRRKDFSPEELSRYAAYCVNDVDLTYKLFHKMKGRFTAEELRVIDITMRMYTDPVIELDQPMLQQHLDEVMDRKSDLVAELGLDCSEEEAKSMLMSNDKFATFLHAWGVNPPTKISPRTGKEAYAFSKTDKAFTDLLEHDNPRVQNAVAARLGVKSTIEQSRTTSLIGVSERGRLPIMLHYYGAHTGRFSGGDKMNLQNLPRGGTLRKSLCAPKGKVLIACDSSQIEARMVAWVSDQNDLLQAFREGRDVYSEFATEVYGKKVTKTDKVERFVGKTCILGLGYGMGAIKFRDALALGQGGIKVEIDEHTARNIVQLYRNKNHRIAMFWNRCTRVLGDLELGREGQVLLMKSMLPYKDNSIILPNGLSIQYPLLLRNASGEGLFYISDGRTYRKAVVAKLTGESTEGLPWVRIYGGKVTENIVQALARIVVTGQMVAIAKRYKIVLQVHDEVVCCVDEAEAEEAKAFIMQCMSTPPSWAPDLPVACEADIGSNYGDAK
jgi:DNA polymerase